MSDNEEKKPRYHFSINGFNFTSEMPRIIMGAPVNDIDNIPKVYIDVNNSVKEYPKLYYTTEITALRFILTKLTLRSSSLINANLNDKTEKKRVGVSQFAGSRFITCFSHKDNENVHFWYNYGGKERSKKILLKFNNFANHIEDAIHTDYCLLAGNKKAFFVSDEYQKTINQNGVFGTIAGLPKINEDYDLRNAIASLEMFDVEYLPAETDEFTKDYSGEITVYFDEKNLSANPSKIDGIMAYEPNCLGKQKSNPWEGEYESRILCCLEQPEFDKWDYIDLRLKEEIFRDMTIVLSPWLSLDLEENVKKIIEDSPIKEEIKQTIKIEHSILENTIQ